METKLSDAKFAEEVLARKLLGPASLKAALDYQASVGGDLRDIITKLGLVKESVLEDFLRRLEAGEDFVLSESQEDEKETLGYEEFDVSKLRVHKKLLEKAPPELVEKCGVLVFFPTPGSRLILLSSNPPLGGQGVKKLGDLLGVQLVQVELTEEERAAFLSERVPPSRMHAGAVIGSGRERSGSIRTGAKVKDAPARPAAPTKAPSAAPRSSGAASSEEAIRALVQLLVKKGVITADELQVELGILRTARTRAREEVT